MPMPNAMKAMWTVRGGLWPGNDQEGVGKRWSYNSTDYEADCKLPETVEARAESRFLRMQKEATDYWLSINDPRRLNWASLEFTWM